MDLSPPSPHSRRAMLLGLGGALCLGGCRAPTPPLRLGSIVFSGYEPVFLARSLGWLDPNQVRLVELLSNTDTLRALAAHQIEAAQLTLDEFLTARAGGLDLRVIAVLDLSQGADAVVARPGLTNPTSLKGRKVAVEDGAVGAVMLSAFLRANGLQASDITKVPYTMDRSLDDFKAGVADLFVTASPWLGQLEAAGGRRLFDSAAIPERIVDVLVARTDVFNTHAAALRQVVQAHFQAVARFKAAPETVLSLMAPRLQLPPSEVRAAFEGLMLPDAHTSASMLGAQGPLLSQVKTLLEVMVQDGLLRQTFPLNELFDTRFHPPGR